MKVLSGHVVTKSQFEDRMDLFIMPAPAAHLMLGHPLPQETHEGSSVNSAHSDNINRKRWRSLFSRVQRKNMDSGCAVPSQRKSLFGQALTDICGKNACPPKPIMDILSVLRRRGPHTLGVFRKAGSARRLKEIKEGLNSGVEVHLKDEPVILLADLLKDFLRHLPGGLLVVEQYHTWMAAMEKDDVHERCTELQRVVNNLPEVNIHLLKHLIGMLHQISVNAATNKMDSNNLALCVSPNLLRTDNMEMMKNVSNLTQFLIDNCCEIFGEDSLTQLGDSDEEDLTDNQDSFHHDSAYDSNDPDVSGSKESVLDMRAVHSDPEDKPLRDEKTSCSHGAVGRQTANPFFRRCSEPAIIFTEGVRNQTPLTRSQTEMNFYDQRLTKQISDECVLFESGRRLLPAQGNICTWTSGQLQLQGTSKANCSCSSSSLESTVSSASDTSFHTSSPVVFSQRRALQRKQSFPARLMPQGNSLTESPKKRSQSMKATNSRTKASFARGGTSKRAEKVLRHSQTLPEVLPLSGAALQKRLSSQEVFQQVDSRVPSSPPSYEQALEDNGHPMLSQRRSLTVEAARCLSKNTCGQSAHPAEGSADSCSVKNCSDIHCCESAESTHISPETAVSPESRQTEVSTTNLATCGQQLALGSHWSVRESYV
ncbi:T cell activation RhoGTPase activating protein a [Brachyhypopomus gauderio]|uniref:T cell activation RhoGTPase activating protein a n=1 Tax=Brachyhypopomus gauderio TaxID=698409 RepID=UPI00404330FA